MAEALEEANSGLSRTLMDLFAGAVGGVAQVLIGMAPSELVSMLHCWRVGVPPVFQTIICLLFEDHETYAFTCSKACRATGDPSRYNGDDHM